MGKSNPQREKIRSYIIPSFHYSIIPFFLCFLGVRDQPFHVSGIPFIHHHILPQLPLPFGGLAGKKMAGIGFGTLDLPPAVILNLFAAPRFVFNFILLPLIFDQFTISL
jgi:hypothetical protein